MQNNNMKYGYGEKIILKNVEYIQERTLSDLKNIFSLDFKGFVNVLEHFSKFIEDNKDYKYETIYWDGVRKELKLGEGYDLNPFDRTSNKLSNYPLSTEIVKFKEEIEISLDNLIQVDYYLEIVDRIAYSYSPRYLPWVDEILVKFIPLKELSEFAIGFKELKYRSKVITYIKLLIASERDMDKYLCLKNISEILYGVLSGDELASPYLVKGNGYFYGSSNDALVCSREVSYFLRKLQDLAHEDSFFEGYFKVAYNYYRKSKYKDFATLNQSSFIKWESKMVE